MPIEVDFTFEPDGRVRVRRRAVNGPMPTAAMCW